MQGYATVKAVPSGDTLQLFGDVTSGPPSEMQLTLAFISAPRIARGSEHLDDPFGYESREFLRSIAIGRRVRFKVEYKVEKIGRTFASIYLDDEDLGKLVVRNGWATVKSERSTDEVSADHDELVQLEAEAQRTGRGMHNKSPGAADASVRSVVWDHPDPTELYGLLAGTPQRATVEHVRDGASLRLYIPHYATYTNLNLAGVRCPRLRPRLEDGSTGEPEEFAREALFFTEVRLLHRSVIVHVEGIGKTGGLFGTVEHPNGNISTELVRLGLGTAVGWSANFTSAANQAALRKAQDEARGARRGLWVNAKVAPPVTDRRTVQGTVGEVVSGDALIILDGPAGAEPGTRPTRRLYLASVRAPRQGNRENAAEPWGWQAKEELRRMLIGRRVDIIIDYSRKLAPMPGAPADAEPKTRVYGTVLVAEGKHKGKNAGVELVRRGLAEVVRHRMDEDRASCFDQLMDAELVAKARKQGLHSKPGKGGASDGTFRVNDLTGNSARAKAFLPHLKRAGLKAVVHHCFNGHRFKVYVPSEKCMVMLSLAGIRCPNLAKPARNGRPAVAAEPYGSKAVVTAKERVLQREVEVEVETMDSHGNALGSLFLGPARENFAVSLLRQGLATVVPYSADRSLHADELYDAEAEAKRARRCVWENVEVQAEEERAVESGESETVLVSVCNVDSGARFTIHVDGDPAVPDMDRRMAEFTLRHGKGTVIGAPVVQARRGLVCAALMNGSWQRVRVVEADGKATDRSAPVAVEGLDTGRRDTVTAAHLRPLEGALARAHPAARPCTLAFVRVEPPSTDVGLRAAEMFDRLTAKRALIAEIHGRDDGNRLTVTLRDDETGASVAEQLVEAGLARVSKTGIRTKQAEESKDGLLKAQRIARRARIGMFQFGEPDDSDTEQ